MATETAAGRRAAAQDRVAHRLRRGLAGSGAGFAGCALAALGSLGLPWLHDARHGASGWALLGA